MRIALLRTELLSRSAGRIDCGANVVTDARSTISKLSTLVAGAVCYLPVLAGIITPMLWILPAWYVTWYGLGYLVPYSQNWSGLWDPIQNTMAVELLWVVSLGTFLPGLALLLYGLKTMVRARLANRGLVTDGPYQWIRHPQHLGIILMLFLPTLLYGVGGKWYIRPGDFISLSVVSFFLLVVADIEEVGLMRRFGSEYADYCSRTPFIIPVKAAPRLSLERTVLSRGKPGRYILGLLVFWVWLVFLSFLFELLPLDWVFVRMLPVFCRSIF